jgi:hypothetical protein
VGCLQAAGMIAYHTILEYVVRERIRDFDKFHRYTDKVLFHLQARAQTGLSIDVQDIFGRFTLDAAGGFLFGTDSLNTLDSPLPIPGKAALGMKGSRAEGDYGGFAGSFEQLQVVMAVRDRWNKCWAAREFFKDHSEERNAVIDAFVEPLVIGALQKKAARGEKECGIDDGNLVDHLADATNDVRLIRYEVSPLYSLDLFNELPC